MKQFFDLFFHSDCTKTNIEVTTFHPLDAQKLAKNPDMSKWAKKLHLAAAIFLDIICLLSQEWPLSILI
jgi:hypothetical protein